MDFSRVFQTIVCFSGISSQKSEIFSVC